jgi:hypothetical protein
MIHASYSRVESDRKQHRGEREGLFAEHTRGFGHGQRVQVDDSVENVVLVLARHPVS